ncbi:palmitoyltransferase ZDHHC23-like isoform X2 [Tubulanus polymorphus]|uniref:palmitoyltransferase ZDHHC23-like isoform X2 n=1 Tax=Tubulanus polymorphus TaxID=672921 RepID=UPI003DA3141F
MCFVILQISNWVSIIFRFITCRSVSPGTMNGIIDAVVDRCRFPMCFGTGAVKVRFDVLIPVVLVPTLWMIAAYGPWLSVFVMAFATSLVALVHSTWKRRFKTYRTKFFFSWGMTSVFCMLYVFETVIVALREILLWENLICVTLAGAILYCVYLCKTSALKYERSASSVQSAAGATRTGRKFHSVMYSGDDGEEVMKVTVEDESDDDDDGSSEINHENAESIKRFHNSNGIDSRPIKDGNPANWCDDCKRLKKLRSSHCTVCNVCVNVRDHHCIWLDCCIGEHNHRSFYFCMVLCVILGIYGSHISLTSICTPEMYNGWFLYANDCRFLYADIRFASAFVGIVYAIIGTAVVLCGVIIQSIFISQNITQQEHHRARNNHTTKCQFFAFRNSHNYGVLRNWRLFLKGQRSIADDHII